jgi:DNA-binding response OmpR family regulator
MSQISPNLTTILLVEPDDTVRPILRENLYRWGYAVIVTLDAADALQRTRNRDVFVDLLLLNQIGASIEECLAVGRQIREQVSLSSQIPLVVMAERYGAELEGQNIQMGDGEYVTYLEDGEQLRELLYRLCPVQTRESNLEP